MIVKDISAYVNNASAGDSLTYLCVQHFGTRYPTCAAKERKIKNNTDEIKIVKASCMKKKKNERERETKYCEFGSINFFFLRMFC